MGITIRQNTKVFQGNRLANTPSQAVSSGGHQEVMLPGSLLMDSSFSGLIDKTTYFRMKQVAPPTYHLVRFLEYLLPAFSRSRHQGFIAELG